MRAANVVWIDDRVECAIAEMRRLNRTLVELTDRLCARLKQSADLHVEIELIERQIAELKDARLALASEPGLFSHAGSRQGLLALKEVAA